MTPEEQSLVGRWLSAQTGRRFADRAAEAVHGGSINQCVRWPGEGGDAFVKVADAANLSTYEAEAEGLAELRDANALRVPELVAVGLAGDRAVIALEWFDLSPLVADQAEVQARLGEGLAMQHRVSAPRFGWRRANTIGATTQANDEDDDWVRFFQRRRLGYQLDLAASKGLNARIVDAGRELNERCGAFFSSYRPVPSLLHGDLWGGNWSAIAATRVPVLYDPAVYYGDREADVAMTRLFGGFGPGFYAAYQAAWPLDPAAGTRRTLYNLYHVLNHYNLFGGSYARQAFLMIQKLLAEFG
jgi:protein-ribulosamine 3-kinase